MTDRASRNWLIFAAILVLISLFILFIPTKRTYDDHGRRFQAIDTAADSMMVVSRVIDGDTYILNDSIHVRLIGIDTPEKNQPFYLEARNFADSALTGSGVRLEFGDEKNDNYGRNLVYLYKDSLLFNEVLLSRGLASVYLFPGNDRFAERLIAAQKQARKAKRGVWSLAVSSPEDYYVSTPGSMRFHRPLCPHLRNSDENRLIRYQNREFPLDSGLSPCRFCRP